jgi:hypothetical protein
MSTETLGTHTPEATNAGTTFMMRTSSMMEIGFMTRAGVLSRLAFPNMVSMTRSEKQLRI